MRFSAGMRMAATAKCLVSAFVCALPVLLLAPDPAFAQTQCAAAVNGTRVDGLTSPRQPLEVDASSTVRIQALAPADATDVRVEAAFPFASREVAGAPIRPGDVFDDSVNVRDLAPFGVGLYRVRIESGSCSQTVWVRITGRSPFTTVAGLAATATILAGVALLVVGMVRAARGRGGVVWATIGGSLTGFGALVLSQQLGGVGLTDRALVTWIALPGIGGAALNRVSAALFGGGSPASAPAPAPTPAEAPVPPPAQPGPVAAPPPATARPEPSPAQPSPSITPEPAAPAPAAADPPREAYARLDAPEAVVAEETFELVVGLAPEPMPGVVGGPLVRPPSSVGPYTLVVQVVADGFALAAGDNWRRELPVTVDAPYPTVRYHLAREPRGGRGVVATDPGVVLGRRTDDGDGGPVGRDRRARRRPRHGDRTADPACDGRHRRAPA